jgi:hypothetical protein
MGLASDRRSGSRNSAFRFGGVAEGRNLLALCPIACVICAIGRARQNRTLSLVPAIRHTIAAIDPQQGAFAFETMDFLLSNAEANRRLQTIVLAVFAALAVLLAAIGVYSVMAYSAARRTREIGVRLALGARPADVIAMLVEERAGDLRYSNGSGLCWRLRPGAHLERSAVWRFPPRPGYTCCRRRGLDGYCRGGDISSGARSDHSRSFAGVTRRVGLDAAKTKRALTARPP